MKTIKKITSKNPIVNEIIASRAMDNKKINRLNRNDYKKATGWLSDSRNK